MNSLKCPSVEDGLNKLWNIHTSEYFIALPIKMNYSYKLTREMNLRKKQELEN